MGFCSGVALKQAGRTAASTVGGLFLVFQVGSWVHEFDLRCCYYYLMVDFLKLQSFYLTMDISMYNGVNCKRMQHALWILMATAD
jgi:hypothetical protein